MITVFRRDDTGSEKRTENAAIILHNGLVFDLLRGNADEQALEAPSGSKCAPNNLKAGSLDTSSCTIGRQKILSCNDGLR